MFGASHISLSCFLSRYYILIKLEPGVLVFVEGGKPKNRRTRRKTFREKARARNKPGPRFFLPVKPLRNLEPCYYKAVLFTYSKDDGRLPSCKKFQAYTLLRFYTDDLKMALRARKLSGAFEKRAPGAITGFLSTRPRCLAVVTTSN